MEIKAFKLSRLRSEEHFQFQTGVYDLLKKHKTMTAGVTNLVTAFNKDYITEQNSLDCFSENRLTAAIKEADEQRNSTIIGFNDAISSCTRHFNDEVKEAGLAISTIVGHYGTIQRKNYEAKSAAINDLILELTSNFAEALKATATKQWIVELKKDNTTFKELQNERYTADANSDHITMTDARAVLDISYKALIKMINALALVNGVEKYESFIKELNERIDSYNLLIQRRSSKVTDDEPTDIEESEELETVND